MPRSKQDDSLGVCDACGAPVDPLRAPYVACIDERFRYYCTRSCRDLARTRVALAAPKPSEPLRERPLLQGPGLLEAVALLGIPSAALPDPSLPPDGEAQGARALSAAPRRPLPLGPDPAAATAAVSIAVISKLTAVLIEPASHGVLVLWALSLAATGFAARQAWRARHDEPLSAVMGVAAAMLPWIDALTHSEKSHRALTESAVLAAFVPCAAWVRASWDLGARARLNRLCATVPLKATVLRSEGVATVATNELRLGDRVLVERGATIPVDGVVSEGSATVLLHSEATEGRPRATGDAVLAGQPVLDGEIQLTATRGGDEFAWARLGSFMALGSAQPGVVTLSRRLAAALSPALGIAAVVVALTREFFGPGEGLRAAAWLVGLTHWPWLAAALTEAPFVRVLCRAARRGIVFRDAASVESAARVAKVALCTRGTITRAKLELTDVASLGQRGELELLSLAASAEAVAGEDPIAEALIGAARARGARVENTRRTMLLPGRGITALNAKGEPLVLGDRRLLLAEGIAVSPAEQVACAIECAGRSTVLMGVNGRVEAVFGFDDPVREEARSAVQSMIDSGFDVAVLGGASRGTIEAIGAMLDVTNLRPEVLPEERAGVVRAMSEAGSGVAVIGRPGTDGAALGAADVAISVEAAGGVGGESALALASDDLRDAALALSMARKGTERAVAIAALAFGLVSAVVVGSAAAPDIALTLAMLSFGVLLALRTIELRST